MSAMHALGCLTTNTKSKYAVIPLMQSFTTNIIVLVNYQNT